MGLKYLWLAALISSGAKNFCQSKKIYTRPCPTRTVLGRRAAFTAHESQGSCPASEGLLAAAWLDIAVANVDSGMVD